MQTRPLGPSGIEASVVALGTWAIGGSFWGGTDEADSIRAIQAAVDHGITLIDTAPIYGYGLSETIVGKAIRNKRDQVVLATKCGMVANTTRGQFKFTCDATGPNPNGLIDIYQRNHPDSIRWEVERSLKRLGTDHIDLYQTHWQENETPIDKTMDCLVKLKKEGKIRAIGVCNASPGQMDQYRAAGQLDSDQEKYSMLDRGLEQEQLPYAREHHLAVLAYSPMALGLLTGKITPDREFPEGDLRRGNPRFTREHIERVRKMLEAFAPIREQHDCTQAQLTIAWTFHQPGLTHALCGGRSVQQVRDNVAAGDIQLSDQELMRMNETLDDHLAAAA